eukprot:767530-Hanusia_phi.AAC.6
MVLDSERRLNHLPHLRLMISSCESAYAMLLRLHGHEVREPRLVPGVLTRDSQRFQRIHDEGPAVCHQGQQQTGGDRSARGESSDVPAGEERVLVFDAVQEGEVDQQLARAAHSLTTTQTRHGSHLQHHRTGYKRNRCGSECLLLLLYPPLLPSSFASMVIIDLLHPFFSSTHQSVHRRSYVDLSPLFLSLPPAQGSTGLTATWRLSTCKCV